MSRAHFLAALIVLPSLLLTAEASAQCDPPLDPIDDGSGAFGALGLPPVIISEINPGDYIELYNTTAAPFNTTGYYFCSPFVYKPVSVLIPAGSYVTIPWDNDYEDTDAGGEFQLYRSVNFGTSTDIVDFICWGTNPHGSRKAQAQAVGKWIGNPCAPVLANGAIHRKIGTKGNTPADYDVTSAPSPMNCSAVPTGAAPRIPAAKLSSYPNPFSSSTQIEVSLSVSESVTLAVYSVDGSLVRKLGRARYPAGDSRVIWDGTDDAGAPVASGTYLVRVTGASVSAVSRVTILR